MFAALKSFVNPLPKIITPKDDALEQKLQRLSSHILSSENPFQQWHYLNLTEPLSVIYTAASQEQKISIIQFFTLLIYNSKDNLLKWKLLSNQLVLLILTNKSIFNPKKSAQEILTCTPSQIQSLQKESTHKFEEFDDDFQAYKINLMKAYFSILDRESANYMVIDEKLPVLQSCIQLYLNEKDSVNLLSLQNCLLNAIKKSEQIPLVWQTFNGNTLANFFKQSFNKLIQHYNFIIQANQKQQFMKTSSNIVNQFEDMILFLVDFLSSLQECQNRKIALKLSEKYVQMFFEKFSTTQKQYKVGIWKLTYLLELIFQTYGYGKQFTHLILQKSNKLSSLLTELLKLFTEQTSSPLQQHKSLILLTKLMKSKELCIQKNQQQAQQQIDNSLDNICIFLEQLFDILYEKTKKIQSSTLDVQIDLARKQQILMKNFDLDTIKYAMLCTIYTFTNSAMTPSRILCKRILLLYQCYLQLSRYCLSQNQYWDDIIVWHEDDIKDLSQKLLQIPTHQLIKASSKNSKLIIRNILVITEYIRNYRYMLIKQTQLASDSLKMEKIYYKNFKTVGWDLKPGVCISLQQIENFKLTHKLNLLNTGYPIPGQIIEDEQCLVIMLCNPNGPQTQYKILLNLRFKNIKGILHENKILKLQLRSNNEELIIQGNNNKQVKEYLIKQRQRCRQKQLKFIHDWLKKLVEDTQHTLNLFM